MNLEALERKLYELARLQHENDSVPFGFETRVMAQIRGAHPVSSLEEWSRALWRAVGPCVGIAGVLLGWTLLFGQPTAAEENFAQAFESTLLAEMEQAALSDLSR